MVGFEVIKDLYVYDFDFGEIWKACVLNPFKYYMIVYDYLFKGNLLLIPVCSLRLSIFCKLTFIGRDLKKMLLGLLQGVMYV